MDDKQLIYARLIDCLNSVAFINELEGLKNASPERLKLFVEVKRQVRKELQELAHITKEKKSMEKKNSNKKNEPQKKFCPFSPDHECKECNCELWLTSVYSTENIVQKGRCSIRFMAEKNSEGLLPV